MITYSIGKREEKPVVVVGSDGHKHVIFARTVELVKHNPKFVIGDYYKLKGMKDANVGMLIHIIDDFHAVEWDGLKVKCLEIWVDDLQEILLVHPSELERCYV